MSARIVKQQVEERIDPRALRAYRLARVQGELRRHGLGAALLFEPQNIRYATDLTNANLLWTAYTPVRYAFVPARGLPIMFEYALDTCPVSASALEFIAEVRPAISFASFYKLDAKQAQIEMWCGEIEDLMRAHCGADRRLAVDALAPPACAALISAGFQIEDGDGMMVRARLIKSPDEIECLRGAVRVADMGALAIREAMRPGVTEFELWAHLHRVNIEQGGEWIETRLLTSGRRANPWYQSASEKRIEDGELIVFDTDMVGPFGYVGDISRAVLCAERASESQRRAYRVAYDNLHHNIELLRPGVSFREIAESCYEPPEPFRAYQEAIGHGAGLQIEFPLINNREKFARTPYPDMVLEPGMVICAEAYAGEVGGEVGVKLEQQLAITDSGFEIMSGLGFEDTLLA